MGRMCATDSTGTLQEAGLKKTVLNSASPSAAYMRQWTAGTIISSDNGLSPVRRQAITLTNAGLLSIGLIEAKFGEI